MEDELQASLSRFGLQVANALTKSPGEPPPRRERVLGHASGESTAEDFRRGGAVGIDVRVRATCPADRAGAHDGLHAPAVQPLPDRDSVRVQLADRRGALGRPELSQMDLPTRNSYVMAVVTPVECPAAAGLTFVSRSLALSLGPIVAGWLFLLPGFAWPVLADGVLKTGYDLSLLVMFRHVQPPEERVQRDGRYSRCESRSTLGAATRSAG